VKQRLTNCIVLALLDGEFTARLATRTAQSAAASDIRWGHCCPVR
jgi:hypothetical protein